MATASMTAHFIDRMELRIDRLEGDCEYPITQRIPGVSVMLTRSHTTPRVVTLLPELESHQRIYNLARSSRNRVSQRIYNLAGSSGNRVCHIFSIYPDYLASSADILSPSLDTLHYSSSRNTWPDFVLQFADPLISSIERVHRSSFVHRNISPATFVKGKRNHDPLVAIIDLSVAQQYCDPTTGSRTTCRENRCPPGVPLYASINSQMGREHTRRDDIESLGYTMIFLCLGSLPWQDCKAATKEELYNRIKEVKISTPIDDLCEGLPSAFATYMTYARTLGIYDEPDYDHLRGIFRNQALCPSAAHAKL